MATPVQPDADGQRHSVTHFLSPMATHSAELLDQVINRQAEIIAYADDYKLMSFVALPPLILLFLLRRHRSAPVAVVAAPAAAQAEGVAAD